MATQPATPEEAEIEPLSDALMAQFQPVLDEIPWATDDNGEGIIARMLSAQSWEELNATGKLPAFRDLAPCRLKVESIAKHESDIGGRMPVYLLVDCINLATGEKLRAQTSAGQPFLAMAMLHHLGNLPAVIEVRFSDKLTRSGFRPLNVTVEGATPNPKAVTRKGK